MAESLQDALEGGGVGGSIKVQTEQSTHATAREYTTFPLGVEAVFSKHLKEFLTSD